MAGGTRERIMDMALQLFVERGVTGTPVTAIEAAAGLSPGSGSFYRHFKDKPALLSAVVEREIALVGNEPAPPASGELAHRLQADLDFLGRLRPLLTILMWERDRAPQVADRVRQVLAGRAATGSLPQAEAAVLSSAVFGYFLAVEYFGTPPADAGPAQFTAALARLLTG
jgi:AcrR family transcriptional regulator